MPDMSASVSLAMTHLVPLAKEVDENKVTPGVLGFIVFAAMAVAVWGLMKSMSKHMGKVDFKEPASPEEASGKGTTETASPAKG
ncbi:MULTISPECIES: hypothetical protein [unclassified Streptomyces]|jgi:hypothetical protein|uniref:hypothetical protein n=1 Tax=Streptomyces TaxID=1883 RepID=UPI0029BEC243|nr:MULTISPECIES: hypothetical protein [unclassified Streptomyces]MDX2675486.1 hypothetical protein [Streptomyces sp. NY05-11A]MDX3243084.1 hypothetical protein [Streptomyces sp. ME18-1-4]